MKKLILGFVALFAVVTARADNVVYSMAANTASNILSAPYLVQQIQVINSTTNIATVKFFDSATDTTNVVLGATVSYTSYSTNYSTTFTNEMGLLVTNSFTGLYTLASTVDASTNALPTLQTIMVPASGTVTLDTSLYLVRGLAVVPTQNCIISTTYRRRY